MKRIIVQSALKDIRNSGSISQKRSDMINNAPATELCSLYPANKLAGELHPENFRLSAVSCKEDGELIIAELLPEEKNTVFRFREGQMLAVKFSPEESKCSYSVPVMSSSGSNRITVGVSPVSQAYEHFRNCEGKQLTGISFEGNFFYSRIRDGENICVLTDIHGLPSVYGIANSLRNVSLKVFFFGDNRDNFQNLALEPVSVLPDFNNLGKCSIYICGSHEFCHKMQAEISDTGFRPVSLRVLNLGSEEEETLSETVHRCKVICKGETYELECREGEKLLYAIENSDVPINAKCANGECGYCRSRLLSGEVRLLKHASDRRTAADIKYGYIHPCSITPVSDIVIEI
ncbi:MAG: 2Fe-2S iron-sulfur cluster binding domain-containing protein [Ruminococcaceae bacterium]|nr:2Fe-2S iron-sulfur cluster binding domain-containing protein [Oscillospiraceae bacterium]